MQTQSTDQTTNVPPLPETYGRTIGPGHLDMVREMMEEARDLADAVASGENQRNQVRAAKSIDELLEAADRHAAAYEAEISRLLMQSNGANHKPRHNGHGSVLSLEVPIRRIRGQASALHGALCDEIPDDPLIGAAEALAAATDELSEQWERIHESQRKSAD